MVTRSCVYVSVFLFTLTVPLVSIDLTAHQTTINNINISSTDGQQVMSAICPGVEYRYNKINITVTVVSFTICEDLKCINRINQPFHQGIKYEMCEYPFTRCDLVIEAPPDMFVRSHLQRLEFWCESRPWSSEIKESFTSVSIDAACDYHSPKEQVMDSMSKSLYIIHRGCPRVKVRFEAMENHGFIIQHTSTHSGYIILPERNYMLGQSVSAELQAPSGYVIMASFRMTRKAFARMACLQMTFTELNTGNQTAALVCSKHGAPAQVYPTSCLDVRFQCRRDNNLIGVQHKMLFSFYTRPNQPQKLSSGLFNCSMDHYSSFQNHLDCNLKTECEAGQDETEHCPFSSVACRGLVASRNKCFQYFEFNAKISFTRVKNLCLKKGGKMALTKTRKEHQEFLLLFERKYRFQVLMGCVSGWKADYLGWHIIPVMYSKLRGWSDKTVIYNTDFFIRPFFYVNRVPKILCLHNRLNTYIGFKIYFSADENNPSDCTVEEYVCEMESQSEVISVRNVQPPFVRSRYSILTQTQQILFECSDGHVTHLYLSSNSKRHKRNNIFTQYSVLMGMSAQMLTESQPLGKNTVYAAVMFICDDDVTTVPYTVVCDVRQDCPGNDDESFCEHRASNGFECSIGQTVRHSQHCNGHADCLDDSDELSCSDRSRLRHQEADKKYRFVIQLDGTGYFTQQVMKGNDTCPESHYRCTEHWLHCLPIYTRCNGFSDCTYGEDEQDCETVACPGFYQCRSSKVCVHQDHLCDGWGQCPQRDDEGLCEDMTCPEGCLCQGHSFVCPQPFPANVFPQLRYVDATSSGMTLTSFSNNAYLIWLSLSHCSLVHLPRVKFLNIQLINLADNQLRNVNMIIFSQMSNLEVLILANNPLVSLTSKPFNVYYSLGKLDVSRTQLEMFINEITMSFPQLHHLNLSFSIVKTIGSAGLKHVSRLNELDIRGNPVSDFSFDLFLHLSHLKSVFSTNYRLCCVDLLLKVSVKLKCVTQEAMISSCTKLLATEIYRLFCWVVSICATWGNSVCVVVLLMVKTRSKESSFLFLANLKISGTCMGIHTSIIAIANEVFMGKYVYFETTWTKSMTCKMAGFLSLVSSEVTSLILCFVTLDHIIILYFPTTKWRFGGRSTASACAVTWIVGTLLSAIPFLPGLSHWGLKDQSGLCRLALFDCYDCDRQFRWFTVTAVFNFVLSSVVVAGEAIAYRRTPKYQIVIDPTRRSVYGSVHLLAKVSVINALCWFSLGLSKVMILCGVGASDQIHVGLVVITVPLNSAVTPFLYLWTVTTQHRQRRHEEKVLLMFKSRAFRKQRTK